MLAGCTTSVVQEDAEETSVTEVVVVADTNDDGEEADSISTDEQDPDEEIDTSDWLTYENEEYGYTVKYPVNWVVFNEIDPNQNQVLVLNDEDLSWIRFTHNRNLGAVGSFVDVNLIVLENIDDIDSESVKVIEHGSYYYLFSDSDWSDSKSLNVLNGMFNSIEFDS